MSIRRRKKAIGKVVKLLNLATSSNSSEASMALRHAEALIRQNDILKSEIPLMSLCDQRLLTKVSWSGQPRFFTTTARYSSSSASEFTTRRFSEKPVDPSRTYANAHTILDDIQEAAEQSASSFSQDKVAETDSPTASADSQPFENSQEEAVVNQENADCSPRESEDAVETDDMVLNTENEQQKEECSAQDTEKSEAETAVNNGFTHEPFSSSRAADNVIDAASAFRPDPQVFAEKLRGQYRASDPTVPFEDDPYWQKVHEQLLDFDEAGTQARIDALESQLSLAKESLSERRKQRLDAEQEEQAERSERARVEQAFEEAIEKAFLARAAAYEAWEKKRSDIRVNCLRAEQEAQQGFEELNQDWRHSKEAYQHHLQRKEDYRAARIMHDLRTHLEKAVSGGAEGQSSYDCVVAILSENRLSLRDLEFSDIKNKSLFIRLLERETAQIDDVSERERYTEDMLSKFLLSSMTKRDTHRTEDPLQQVEKLLVAASNGTQFEAQKSMEQIFHIMSTRDLSIRDVNLTKITKYSVFVRLLNWEAEQISSLHEREKFTATVLEEYVKSSLGTGNSNEATHQQM